MKMLATPSRPGRHGFFILGVFWLTVALTGCEKLPFLNQAKPKTGPYSYQSAGIRLTLPETWKISRDREVNGIRRIALNGPHGTKATITLLQPGEADPGLMRFAGDYETRLPGDVSILSTSDLRRVNDRQIVVQRLRKESQGEVEVFLRYLERHRRGNKMVYSVFEFPLQAKDEIGPNIAFIKARVEYDEQRF